MSAAPFTGGSRYLALLCVMLTATASAASGAGGASASDTSTVRLYVPNQLGASVSVLDGEGRLLQTVDLHEFGYTDQAMPHQVVATPDGSRWYVTLAGAGEVVAFDAENHLVGRVAVETPGMIVRDASRGRLYVSRALAAVRPPASLAVLREADLTILDEPDVFLNRPHALAVDTVSSRVFTGSLANGTLAVFDAETGGVRLINVPEASNGFVGLAVSPDGRSLVATTQLTNRMLAFDISGDGPPSPVASLDVDAGPYDVAFDAEGRFVWFPNQRANAVTQVDAATWTIVRVVRSDAFEEPHGVVASPDGESVFVTSHGFPFGRPEDEGGPVTPGMTSPRRDGTLAIIDAETGEVRQVTRVGAYAAAPGLSGQ